jgi:hypothetical protein
VIHPGSLLTAFQEVFDSTVIDPDPPFAAMDSLVGEKPVGSSVATNRPPA